MPAPMNNALMNNAPRNNAPRIDDPRIEQVIQTHYDMVFRLAYARTGNGPDAEDIVQEVFLRFIRRQPVFADPEHEKAWFLRVAINCSRTLFARRAKHPWTMLGDRDAVSSDPSSELADLLSRLPQNYRVVIHLFYYEDLRIKDIAQLLERKESTVKMQLTRARRLLKAYLEDEADV